VWSRFIFRKISKRGERAKLPVTNHQTSAIDAVLVMLDVQFRRTAPASGEPAINA
jgi:hypothetical protein